MGQVPALREIEPQNSVAGFQEREVNGGISCAPECAWTFAFSASNIASRDRRQLLDLIDNSQPP